MPASRSRPPRTSPITIVLLAVTISVIGGGGYLVLRPRPPAQPAAADETPPPAADEPREIAPPAALDETAIRARAALAAVAETVMAERAAAAENDKAVATRRLVLASQRHKLLRDADESVFNTLKVPETARAAIRRINADAEKNDEASIAAIAAGTPSDPQVRTDGHDAASDAVRQAAINDVLGPDAAARFTDLERANTRRLKRRSRSERDRELAQQAPLPQRNVAPAP